MIEFEVRFQDCCIRNRKWNVLKLYVGLAMPVLQGIYLVRFSQIKKDFGAKVSFTGFHFETYYFPSYVKEEDDFCEYFFFQSWTKACYLNSVRHVDHN